MMKNLTIFPLHAYWMKYIGLAVAVGGGLCLALGWPPLAAGYFKYAAVTGLYLVAASRQRHESGRVRALRYVSFKASFLYLVGVMLAVGLVDSLFGTVPHGYLLLAFTGLAFHLLLFYGLLKFGPETVEDSHGVMENYRANPGLYRSVLVAVLVAILAIAFLAKQ
jgi:hypothetical protein